MKEIRTPIIGEKFGQWTIVSTEVKSGTSLDKNNRNLYWKVQCNCGEESWRSKVALLGGKTNACKSCKLKFNNIHTTISSYYNKIINGLQTRSVGNLEFNITSEYIQELYDNNPICALSGLDLRLDNSLKSREQVLSLDRIDSTKGYIVGNVQWVHKDINMMKGSLTDEKFINLCSIVSNYNSSSKCG